MITPQQQVQCVERELKLRHRVYPSLVKRGRMTQAQMDHEIACMQAVLATLERLAQPMLFDEEKMSAAIAAQRETLQRIERLLEKG